MRERTRKVVYAFETTVQAMHMEACCMNGGYAGRLIPVPRQITAGCGLAWSAPWEEKEKLEQMMEQNRIKTQGVYDLML